MTCNQARCIKYIVVAEQAWIVHIEWMHYFPRRTSGQSNTCEMKVVFVAVCLITRILSIKTTVLTAFLCPNLHCCLRFDGGKAEGSKVPSGDGYLLHQRNDVPQKRSVRQSSSLRSIRYNSVAYI